MIIAWALRFSQTMVALVGLIVSKPRGLSLADSGASGKGEAKFQKILHFLFFLYLPQKISMYPAKFLEDLFLISYLIYSL